LRKTRTIADAYDKGPDNFLLLRFVAAAMVLLGHSYAISGMPKRGDFIARANWGNGIYTGSIAVDMFFAISGFLVTASFVNRSNLEKFLKSRALRILPAYYACLVLSALVLGCMFTDMPFNEYLTSADVRDYLVINPQFGADLRWELPGVFVHNPFPKVVNGSIWTLPSEVRMYILVAVLGVLGVFRERRRANITLLCLIAIGLAGISGMPLVDNPATAHLAGMFVAGMLFWVNRSYIPLSTILLGVLVCLSIVVHGTFLFPYALGLALTYFCFWFAYVPNLHFFNRFGDYSYGLYLWGFPVQQAVAAVIGHATHARTNFAISLPIALAIAVASWHWLEKPVLRLKSRFNPNAPEAMSSGTPSQPGQT
jgi:peptidoglycan/LPS O-acetylase OafA/YrhL